MSLAMKLSFYGSSCAVINQRTAAECKILRIRTGEMQLKERCHPSTSLQGIRTKFIGKGVVAITAMNSLSRLGVVGKDNDFLATRTTYLF
jgi:hypothetical protein